MPPAHISNGRRIVFASILAVLVFAALEILLQAFYFVTVRDFLFRRALPPIYVSDSVRCYGVAPNLDYVHRTNEFDIQIYTNSLGLRTDESHREYIIPKPDDVFRILVTGPSFAFGWGADYKDIFPTLIESGVHLDGRRIEVMNLGTPSQGSAHQLCWIEKVGHAYQPDLILHVSYGNEVNPVATWCPIDLECPTIEDGQLVPLGVGSVARAKAFMKRFAVVFYGYYAWNSIVKPEPAPDATRSLYSKSETAIDATSDFDALAETYAGHVEYLKRILGPQTDVAFIYLPYSFAVHQEDIVRFPGLEPADIPITKRRIRSGIEAVRARGIEILNTLPALEAAASNERLYYWLDIHFTPVGNHVVADLAIPFVQRIVDEAGARATPRGAPSSATAVRP
jgi:hypothetical protein